MREDLRIKLERAAQNNRRSLNIEMVERLKNSFEQQAHADLDWTGKHLQALVLRLSELVDRLEKQS
jgi:hypothetical protein